jgi:replicative DNA helicase
VATRLRERDQLERVGGAAYLGRLKDTVQTIGSATYYATLIREKSSLRQLLHAAGTISGLAYEGESDVAASLDRAEQLIYGIATRGQSDGSVDITAAARAIYSNLAHTDADSLPTGYPCSTISPADYAAASCTCSRRALAWARPAWP